MFQFVSIRDKAVRMYFVLAINKQDKGASSICASPSLVLHPELSINRVQVISRLQINGEEQSVGEALVIVRDV